MLKNPLQVNIEKFTFGNIEDWQPTTLLQAHSIKKDLPGVLITFLVISYNFENYKNSPNLQNIFHGSLLNQNKGRR